jgi:hypothetical protein
MSTNRHPLGLRETTLLNLAGYRIRLHHWTGSGSDAPHNHRAPFISLPLLGRYAETRHIRIPGSAYRLLATRQHDGQARVNIDAGMRGGLTAGATVIRRPLRPYRCPLDAIHAYWPVGRGPHWSLVLSGRPVRDTSTVWQTEEQP